MIPERHASRRLITVAGAFALAALSARPARGDLTLAYSTYLGGTGDEAYEAFNGIVSIAVDGAGNRYVTGTTSSADFPTTTGAAFGGDVDIFVTKFSPTGAVVYSTYLGGPCEDVSRDIAVDAAGNAYVTGRANGGVCWADVKLASSSRSSTPPAPSSTRRSSAAASSTPRSAMRSPSTGRGTPTSRVPRPPTRATSRPRTGRSGPRRATTSTRSRATASSRS